MATEPTERRLRNLIKRIAAGDCPRATYVEYEALRRYDGIGPLLQLESALAADRSGGNIITALASGYGASKRVMIEATKWLQDHPAGAVRKATKLKSDFSLVDNIEEAQRHPAYQAFELAMKGRAYGREALNDAWVWFKFGWSLHEPTSCAQCKKKIHPPARFCGDICAAKWAVVHVDCARL